jgi:hypothetical protein
MSDAIDRRLLRLTGGLLAAGPGTFGAADVRRLFRGALEDDTLTHAETAAILVASVAVRPLADADARRLFADVSANARQDDPDLEPWIARSISAPLLLSAVVLIASQDRGYMVKRSDVIDLMTEAYQGGPGPPRAITPDEGLAFLVIRELFDGRLAADAQKLLDDFCAAARADGYSLGGSDPSPGGTAPPPRTCRTAVQAAACGADVAAARARPEEPPQLSSVVAHRTITVTSPDGGPGPSAPTACTRT